jgi:hypothetical protein
VGPLCKVSSTHPTIILFKWAFKLQCSYGTFAKKLKILINLQRENKHSKIASFCSVALKIVAKQQMVHTALSRGLSNGTKSIIAHALWGWHGEYWTLVLPKLGMKQQVRMKTVVHRKKNEKKEGIKLVFSSKIGPPRSFIPSYGFAFTCIKKSLIY